MLDRGERQLERGVSGRRESPAALHLSIANLILEPSTRTRCSFELVEQRLAIEYITVLEGSSLAKGETVIDTARTLGAMGINTFVVRHPERGLPARMASALPDAHVVNAGDGNGEHPTQALLDLLTLRRRWGSLEGRVVLIVGDILHSRVARSNYHGLTKVGATVVLCGPESLLPDPTDFPLATVTDDLDASIGDCDALMALRIQDERFDRDEARIDRRAYRAGYGLTLDRLARLGIGVPILHPGPFNRDVEIDSVVADSDAALIWPQVTAGVAIRMGVLEALAAQHRHAK